MKCEKPIHYAETKYGFEWGAATITRCMEHEGHVVLMISTPRQHMEIRVTPSGLIRPQAVSETTFGRVKELRRRMKA